MKLFLKESVYFEVTVPDGFDRAEVTDNFRRNISPMFRDLLKEIVIDPEDLVFLRKQFGDPVDIKVMTEREALNKINSPIPTK